MSSELIVHNTKLRCLKGDITREKVDAIVNAANSGLRSGGGVDGAIHRVGGLIIDQECRVIIAEIGRLEAGKAVLTSGGNLPAKYVIHTVGPVWQGGNNKEPGVLASCYIESLKLATARGVRNIAFPAISTGVYGYPPEKAASVAIAAVMDYIKSSATTIKLVKFVLFDEQSLKIYQRLFEKALKD